MTFFLIGLMGTVLILGGIPLVAFAVMLESCTARQGVEPSRRTATTVRPGRPHVRFARSA